VTSFQTGPPRRALWYVISYTSNRNSLCHSPRSDASMYTTRSMLINLCISRTTAVFGIFYDSVYSGLSAFSKNINTFTCSAHLASYPRLSIYSHKHMHGRLIWLTLAHCLAYQTLAYVHLATSYVTRARSRSYLPAQILPLIYLIHPFA